ncbi:MAG: 50S ribosomal protein L3 [Candidatus Pacebacteria bacterium GW2011_GWF2_38_9]|nr:MAG: 50S ribosomal protein L3, large subunit ribosomal protein L3 [candidate division TM6 bacterium GW2011_GWF2_28_16]KKQ07454.1 MAG: 50S ribosomal protein L3 [Candidatus Pacebacteria bacterium GW2011_GWF1_36_5]KKQ88557.1 MAG: 50S ribosomal protein L3 [Candidatus Pacebacteria bacterium GW2011_GWF2_38_9]MBU1033530.1 50S ribosomal protein L3 [Patescibacteria group bacterium]HAZ73536.1 50S ribosomal protein L3 [Candidatus Paceibacterota bacterium]
MLNTIFATKVEMSQAWSEDGKRLPITKLKVSDNVVLSKKETQDKQVTVEIGYGQKKLKNVAKPLRAKIAKSGFSFGVKQVEGVKLATQEEGETVVEAGQTLALTDVLSIGDVVEIQGSTKGRGFAGAIKRHGFHGGPKTHGQSDRARAVGSIGSGTTPGRVWKGKRMPGRYGCDTKTVSGLVVVYIDQKSNEVWVNGPVPGYRTSTVRISKTGINKEIKLNLGMLGLAIQSEPEVPEVAEVTEESKS